MNEIIWKEEASAIEERAEERGEPVKTAVHIDGRLMRLSISVELIEDQPNQWKAIVERVVRDVAAQGKWPEGLDAVSVTNDDVAPRGDAKSTF